MIPRRFLILLAIGATAVVAGLSAASPAAAADPCWKRLLNDWYDGRIDNVYTVKCYRAAIKHLPADVREYSNAREDIQRALLAAIREIKASGGKVTPDSPIPPSREGGRPVQTGTDQTSTGGGQAIPPTGGNGNDNGDGGLGGVLKPANATSVPLPLIILAGLALVLLAAASAGFVARRLQARRVRPPTPNGRDAR